MYIHSRRKYRVLYISCIENVTPAATTQHKEADYRKIRFNEHLNIQVYATRLVASIFLKKPN